MNGFPAFSRYIGIDHSGAETPLSSLKGSRADTDGSLASFLTPHLEEQERKIAEIEGWILGIV
jgi:hypothetical protein